MQGQIAAPHARLVELKLPASQNTATIFTFPDQPDIRYARVISISIFIDTDMAKTFPSGYASITAAQMITGALVLETNDSDEMPSKDLPAGRFRSTQQNQKYVPLVMLHNVQSAVATPFMRGEYLMNNTYITWEKSFLQLTSALGNMTDLGLGLLVKYSWLDNKGNPIPRN